MADRAIELLNELLKIFNVDSGEYLKLVGDKTKVTSVSGEVKINDINTGAISNSLEYARRLANYLIDQLDLRLTSDSWLDFIGGEIYGILRVPGETDDDYAYRLRIVATLTTVKCTPIGIEQALLRYGDNIRVIDGIDDGAFADVSFANNYKDFFPVGADIIKAAIAGEQGGLLFFFRVIMENVDSTYYKTIIKIINDFKAAGISYIVEIIL